PAVGPPPGAWVIAIGDPTRTTMTARTAAPTTSDRLSMPVTLGVPRCPFTCRKSWSQVMTSGTRGAGHPLRSVGADRETPTATKGGTMPVIEVDGLVKRYAGKTAVDGVDVTVEEGEILGVLGPNGAGKTTAVECIAGLRTPTAGEVRVLGLDPVRDRSRLRQVVGVQLQKAVLPDDIQVGEALELYRSFYRERADVDPLLADLGIADKRTTRFKELSGGQMQRLSLALALVGRPRIALLDELTTGLDPQGRRDIWRVVERLRADGTTVVLVSHFMEEVERLCDRVAVIDDGRIVAG